MYIYFIQQGSDGPVKIGMASDVRKRLVALKHANPYKLHLLCSISTHRRMEQIIHRRFKNHRIRGEWFNPSPDIMSFINKIRKFGYTRIGQKKIQLVLNEGQLWSAIEASPNRKISPEEKPKKNKRKVSPKLAIALEKASSGAHPRWELRPDIWQPPMDTRALE